MLLSDWQNISRLVCDLRPEEFITQISKKEFEQYCNFKSINKRIISNAGIPLNYDPDAISFEFLSVKNHPHFERITELYNCEDIINFKKKYSSEISNNYIIPTFSEFNDVVKNIDSFLNNPNRIIVINGGPSSGKSTIAKFIYSIYSEKNLLRYITMNAESFKIPDDSQNLFIFVDRVSKQNMHPVLECANTDQQNIKIIIETNFIIEPKFRYTVLSEDKYIVIDVPELFKYFNKILEFPHTDIDFVKNIFKSIADDNGKIGKFLKCDNTQIFLNNGCENNYRGLFKIIKVFLAEYRPPVDSLKELKQIKQYEKMYKDYLEDEPDYLKEMFHTFSHDQDDDDEEIIVSKEEYKLLSEKLQKYNVDIFLPYWKPYFEAVKKAVKLAESNLKNTILLLGPTGTGKEKFANLIHKCSKRSQYPLKILNSSAVPVTLIESELFGYAPNSGVANSPKEGSPGLIESANGGYFFFDEVADISYDCQTKLLRAIQEKKVKRLGSNDEKNVDVIFIAATNKNFKTEINDGNIRLDFYNRINGIEIEIPELADEFWEMELENIIRHFCITNKNNYEIHAKEICNYIFENCREKLKDGNFRAIDVLIAEYILENSITEQADENQNSASDIQPNHTANPITKKHRGRRATKTQNISIEIILHAAVELYKLDNTVKLKNLAECFNLSSSNLNKYLADISIDHSLYSNLSEFSIWGLKSVKKYCQYIIQTQTNQ